VCSMSEFTAWQLAALQRLQELLVIHGTNVPG
jgi:hypothetical protein